MIRNADVAALAVIHGMLAVGFVLEVVGLVMGSSWAWLARVDISYG